MPAPRKQPKATPPVKTPAPINNIEPVLPGGGLSLVDLLTNKKNPHTREVAKLGEVLLPWFEKVVAKPASQLDGLHEVWQELVPEKLRAKSRLVGLAKGTLTIALDSAPVRAELDAKLRSGLLRSLQLASKGKVFKVKTCVQTPPPFEVS